jgi:hypothetical protein
LTKETPIGADKVALGEAAGATGVPIEFGTWWSRLGGGFVTPAMFWAPDWVDTSSRSQHVPFLFWLVDALRPMALVALSERPTVSYLGLCQAVSRLRMPTRCYAVSGKKAKRDEWGQFHDSRYAQFSKILPAEQMLERFDTGTVDLVSIDALESGALARHYRAWLPKLSKRAILLVHGIDDPAVEPQTLELWHVLAERHPHFEFAHGGGLGILGIGEDLPPALRHLFSLDATAMRALEVREIFARLGSTIAMQAEMADLQRRLGAALDSDRVAKLETALSATKDALATARVDHVKTLKRLRKIEESSWWRATKPMRQLIKNHRWFVYNLRQWAFCLYWIATFRYNRLKKQIRPYSDAKLVLKSGLMHEAWYLRQYPDVESVGIPPALHYVLYGGYEGRDPSPMFSSQAYLETYPDVRKSKTNPLVHYLVKGRYEKRTFSPSVSQTNSANVKPKR